jgi:hypothetical protein
VQLTPPKAIDTCVLLLQVLYWKYVLLAYQQLIPDMDEYFKITSSTEPLLSQPGDSFMGSLLKQLAAVPTNVPAS